MQWKSALQTMDALQTPPESKLDARSFYPTHLPKNFSAPALSCTIGHVARASPRRVIRTGYRVLAS